MHLVCDEEIERLAAARGRQSAEAFLILELREARSKGERVCAYRDARGRYSIKRLSKYPPRRAGAGRDKHPL
jgi:hypothetical protein